MNPSTPETPAPLSFNNPEINVFFASLRDYPNAFLPTEKRIAQYLTHEHEARVKAEKQVVQAVREASQQYMELTTKLDKAEAERDRYRAALEFEYKENRKLTRGAVIFDFEMFVIEQVRRIEAALSGLPAQAGVKP